MLIRNFRGGTTSIDEQIVRAAVIARVRLLSVSQGVESSDYGVYGMGALGRDASTLEIIRFGDDLTLAGRFVPPKYGSVLVFTFEVLEYLKGSGGGEVVAVAKQQPWYETPDEAVTNSDRLCPRIIPLYSCRLNLLGTRDTQWDGDEAIVFLDDYRGGPQDERFLFGHHTFYTMDGYTVNSGFDKKWLPEASRPGHFWIGNENSQKKIVPLDGFRKMVEEIETRFATAGSSLEYRTCIALELHIVRWLSGRPGQAQDFEKCR